jgi:uncharacterized protein GlcG (DUF336 family)
MSLRLRKLCALLCVPLIATCGGGDGGGSPSICGTGNCAPPAAVSDALTVADVQRIVAQAAGEATARNEKATIAVVDRVGNVLAVFRMTGARTTFKITSGKGVSGGLENIDILPDTFAAISKAITGAYLSSNGNAFSTRTASQIVQENFNPREFANASGPLFGVQFSQLSCSDLMQRADNGTVGPKRSPLGLAADPGGLPLYKNGRLVGGVGVIADGVYGLDLEITDVDQDADELIAVAATSGFSAPDDIRGNRITADGRTFRFVDSEALSSNPANAPAFATLSGALVTVGGFFDGTVRAGTSFGNAASGYRADTGPLAAQSAFILVNGSDANRFPVRAGTDGHLNANEVTTLAGEALKVANRARAQIRRPLGSPAQVTVSIVDSNGEVLAVVRTPDAPVFGTDVSLQKARSALLFSHPNTAADLAALPPPAYLGANGASVPVFRTFPQYLADTRSFFNNNSMLANGIAFSNRAVGNVARPNFPDGISTYGRGPFSTPLNNFSPFHLGLQLDLVYNAIVAAATGSNAVGCTGLSRARNGIQIFPGAVPIFRGNTLIGAIGISGDGIDQDDMIAFLGLANAGRALNGSIGNAPRDKRADNLEPLGIGTRLRYVQCPQAPFNDSTEQNVCEGL